jgi:hypothetical protein
MITDPWIYAKLLQRPRWRRLGGTTSHHGHAPRLDFLDKLSQATGNAHSLKLVRVLNLFEVFEDRQTAEESFQ